MTPKEEAAILFDKFMAQVDAMTRNARGPREVKAQLKTGLLGVRAQSLLLIEQEQMTLDQLKILIKKITKRFPKQAPIEDAEIVPEITKENPDATA